MAMDNIGLADQHCAFDDVFQLTNIAGPVVTRKHIYGRRRNALDALAVLARILLEKMIRQEQNVRLALAQGRHEDRKNVETIVEVLTKLALGNGLLNVLISSSHQPHIALDRFRAAKALELSLLQYAQ